MNKGESMVLVRSAAPLREQAVIVLRNNMISGVYQPGERLTEKNLCDELGVSRTVVREALRQLESERLVDILPNVGPIVRIVRAEEAKHLYEIREALESMAVQFAAERATPEQLAELSASLEEIREALDSSPEQLVAIKDHFYDAIITAAHNPAIGEVLTNIQARISQLRKLTLSSEGRSAEMFRELEEIVEAILLRDSELAYQAARRHVRAASQLAQASLVAHGRAETSPNDVGGVQKSFS